MSKKISSFKQMPTKWAFFVKFVPNQSSGCGGCSGAGFPLKEFIGAGPNDGAAAGVPNGELSALGAADLLNPKFIGAGGAEGGGGLLAASNALARRSLSSPANMMPDRVPVKNVAMGMINSKNLLSTGLIPFMGCVTNMRL